MKTNKPEKLIRNSHRILLGNFLIPLALCLLVLAREGAEAVPACPEPATVRQPDGRTIQVYLRGDEFLHWHEDSAGFTVLQNPKDSSWVYAVRDATGNLVPSASAVGRDAPKQLGVPLRLLPTGAIERAAARQGAKQSAPAAPTGPIRVPRTGAMKNLVVLVQFSDKAGTRTKAEFEALFNTIGYTVDGAVGSVKDYYNEVSYNTLDVQSVVADWVTLDNGYAYYGANDAYGNDLRPREMVAEALAKLEARGFDFSTLDADGDGWVDGLTIIHAGGGEEYSGNDANYIWSHQWSMIGTVTYDGKSMLNYHTEPERRGWDSSPAPKASPGLGSSVMRRAISSGCRTSMITAMTVKAPAISVSWLGAVGTAITAPGPPR